MTTLQKYYNYGTDPTMKINEETKVRTQGEISLITTIPKTYVKALKIEPRDTLEWILDTETERLELNMSDKSGGLLLLSLLRTTSCPFRDNGLKQTFI